VVLGDCQGDALVRLGAVDLEKHHWHARALLLQVEYTPQYAREACETCTKQREALHTAVDAVHTVTEVEDTAKTARVLG
jgi:hypothetical protein